jgi:hypothetical protein
MTGKELLHKLIKVCAEEGKRKTVLLVVVDEDGVSSTIKVSRAIEEFEPSHVERALIILSANYYEHFILPEMGKPDRYRVEGDDMRPLDDPAAE